MSTLIDNDDRGPTILGGFLVFVGHDDRIPRYRVNKAIIRRTMKFKVGDRVVDALGNPGTITGIKNAPWTDALDYAERVSVSSDNAIYGRFTVSWDDGSQRESICGRYLKNYRGKKT